MVKPDRKAREVSSSLKHFYDSYGWKQDEGDSALHGSIIHEDQNQDVKNYIEANELRYKPLFSDGGSFFLDIGCGAKPRSELAENFREHICVDISIVGLNEARKVLGASGQYILADMTELPFKSGTCDAALVCHCLYHVDKDLQISVLKDLYRIIKFRKRILVFYSSRHNLISAAHLPLKLGYRAVNLLLNRFGLDLRPYRPFLTRFSRKGESAEDGIPSLYSYPYNPNVLAREFETSEVTCLATLTQYDSAVLKRLGLVKLVMPVLSFLEKQFPKGMSYIGKYTCINIEKSE